MTRSTGELVYGPFPLIASTLFWKQYLQYCIVDSSLDLLYIIWAH